MSDEFVRRLRERVDGSVPVIPVETSGVVPRARRRRALVRSVGAVAAVAVLGGSVWTAGAFWPGRTATAPFGVETAGQTGSPVPAVPAEQRAGLFGVWKVTADGEGSGTFLKLDGAGQADVWRDCGVLMGSWAVGPTRFVGYTSGSSQSCTDGPSLPWLENAAYYRADGDGWQLLDGHGALVATLRHDGAPASRPDVSDDMARPPVADDAMRAWVSDPAPLPAGVTPVTADLIAGRWVAAGSPVANDPYVELSADGDWTGSDGCNGTGGRWAADLDGRLVVVGGGSTLMLCDGAPLPDHLVTARRAALSGTGDLLLFDNEGAQVAQLTRVGGAPGPTATPSQGPPIRTALPTNFATPTGSATGTGSGTFTEPIVSCGVGTLSAATEPLVATSEGVPLLVQSDGAPALTYLHVAWDDDASDLELSATPTKRFAPIPPGTVHLSCSSPGATWGDLTLTVVDPGGYWRPATIKDEGCPGDASEIWPKIPSDALYGATRQEAMDGLLSLLHLDGSVTTRQLPVGYPDDPMQWWLMVHNGAPYVVAVVRPSGNGFMAIPSWHCLAS